MKRARDIRDQVLGLMERVEVAVVSDRSNEENIKKAVASGFFYHTAKLAKSGADYRTVKNPQTVHVHPQSGLIEVMPVYPCASRTSLKEGGGGAMVFHV